MNFSEFSSFPTQKDNLRKSLFPFSLIKLKTKNINSLNTSFVSYQQKILGKTAELLKVNNKHNINNTNLFEIYQLNCHQTKKRKKTLIPCYTKKIKSKSAIEVPIINNNNNTSFQELKSPVYWKNKKQSTNSLPDTTLNNYYSTNMTTHMSLIGKSKSCIEQTIGYTFPKEKSSRETLTINASKTRKNIDRKNKIIPVKPNSLVNSLSQKYKKLIKVKLVQIDSLIFYFKCYNEDKRDELNSQFTLTKIILAKYLFPQVIKYPTIKDFYQLQLTSCLQNTQSVLNLYSKNEKRLIAFKKKLFHSQGLHSRGIRDIYKFGREIGKGKFGTIYKGTHIASLRTIAIKEVSKYETGKSNVYTSVKWEKEIFKFLSNSECEAYNIIKCYEYIETPNYIYYIMEYVKNGDLKTYLNDTPKISENIINSICKQMLSALSFLHSNGIIHRDIKLTNTMITKYNSSISVKIIDFGLSRIIAHDDFIYENFGTLIFKAPEIMKGNNYNLSVDLWSFGMTIFYLMFRKFPVEEKDKALYKKKILNENFMDIFIQKGITYAEYATKVIFQCLVKEPSKRKSACELLQ